MSQILTDDEINPADRLSAGADGLRLADAGNAIRLVQLHGSLLRYVRQWGKWLVYVNGRWIIDTDEVLVTRFAKDVPRAMFEMAGNYLQLIPYEKQVLLDQQIIKLKLKGKKLQQATNAMVGWTTTQRNEMWAAAKTAERRANISGMISLARDLPGVLIEHTQLDNDPFILNVRNGCVDLKTGTLEQWSQNELCTKQSPVFYKMGAVSSFWLECLKTWQPEQEMRDYLQLEAGAYLTGFPTETLSIHYGVGGNGKSKYFGALQHILSEYAVIPHRSLVLQTKYEQHDTVKAALCGARLAVLPETGTQSKLNAENVKNMTGGDKMAARRMREDLWEFMPTHTLVMFCNHMPIILDRSDGIWRRVRVVPWEVTIPEEKIDATLAVKLQAESQGILSWAVAGAMRFIAGGCQLLPIPSKVAVSTSSYKQHENVSGRFISECLKLSPNQKVSVEDMKHTFDRYCDDNGIDRPPWSEMTEALALAGGESRVSHSIRYWHGFELVSSANLLTKVGVG